MRNVLLLMWVTSVTACAGGPTPFSVDDSAVEGTTLTITVEPADVLIYTGADGGEPVQFEAWADAGDGELTRLDVVEWTLSNRSMGTLSDDGLFEPSTTNGGQSFVTAVLDGAVGTAKLSTIYREEIGGDGLDTSGFQGTSVPVSDTWLYPPDGVNVPRNTPALHFQWNDLGAELYRLSFRAPSTEITVWTTQREWVADNATWTTIASTNAGGSVEVTLAAQVGDEIWEEPPRTIEVNRFDADGSIIYWSTSVGGFVEIPYAMPARDFLTQDQAGRCVACHAISSTGQLAFTYDGGNGPMGLRQMSDDTEVITHAQGVRGNFKTFSADGRFLLASHSGRLDLYEAATGAWLSTVVDDGTATHPDWAPDDSAIVYATSTAISGSDWTFTGDTQLVVRDHLGDGAFGPPRVLVQGEPGTRVYYPAWSPDSAWVAFNISTGDAYDDPDATLHVVDREAKLPPVALDAANSVGELTNSWSRWGPLPDDDVMWLAFASKRAYGFQSDGNPQIWLTAFDPALAADGIDPSWPAMWLPGQDTTTNNHIPQWTE